MNGNVMLDFRSLNGFAVVAVSVLACGFARNAFKLTVEGSFTVKAAFVANFYTGLFVSTRSFLALSTRRQASKEQKLRLKIF